jgi:3-hydroxyisobutyrate dehydrogenase-like beta-hydroxyacid dehydrogenase
MNEGAIRRVGIIGLGKMGQPMARHLRKAGFEVTACDIDERARGAAQRAGVAVAADPRAVAARSDFVIVVVASTRRPKP